MARRAANQLTIPIPNRLPDALSREAETERRSIADIVMTIGRLLVATSYDAGRTKTDVTRRVPVHPTLARILAAWKLSHWERVSAARLERMT